MSANVVTVEDANIKIIFEPKSNTFRVAILLGDVKINPFFYVGKNDANHAKIKRLYEKMRAEQV